MLWKVANGDSVGLTVAYNIAHPKADEAVLSKHHKPLSQRRGLSLSSRHTGRESPEMRSDGSTGFHKLVSRGYLEEDRETKSNGDTESAAKVINLS
jgi:hypothetical protein